MEIHYISAERLTIERVGEILENNIPIALSQDAVNRIVRCREYLDNKMKNSSEPIYGVSTGFGSLCNISIGYDELGTLQKNLVMSHACGTGERVPSEIVKLMLLLKIQSLSYGHSGVQLATVERLVDFYNNDILPPNQHITPPQECSFCATGISRRRVPPVGGTGDTPFFFAINEDLRQIAARE